VAIEIGGKLLMRSSEVVNSRSRRLRAVMSAGFVFTLEDFGERREAKGNDVSYG